MTPMQRHPYLLGGAPRAYYLTALAVQLIPGLTIGIGAIMIIPSLPWDAPPEQIRASLHAIDNSVTFYDTVLRLSVALGAIILTAEVLAYYLTRQAWSSVPGADAWRCSGRDSDYVALSPHHGPSFRVWLSVWAVTSAVTDALIASKGIYGGLLIVSAFGLCVPFAIWRRVGGGDTSRSTAAILGMLPAVGIVIVDAVAAGRGVSLLAEVFVIFVAVGAIPAYFDRKGDSDRRAIRFIDEQSPGTALGQQLTRRIEELIARISRPGRRFSD